MGYIIRFAITIFLCLSQVTAVDSSDFKIKQLGKDRFMQKKDKELKLFKLTGVPEKSKVLKIINNPKAKHLHFIIYLSGYAGTSIPASFYKAVIWDDKKQLFVGNILYETVINEGDEKKLERFPARWDFNEEKLEVFYKGKKIDEIMY